jgi:hypothetical protein
MPTKKILRTAQELLGKSEAGPGIWILAPKRSDRGAEYQEQITGVERTIEYEVRTANGHGVKFDGYDAERKTLLDAKDWTRYPPRQAKFWCDKVAEQAEAQLEAADGMDVEWHFSCEDGIDTVHALFDERWIGGVTFVLTPKD